MRIACVSGSNIRHAGENSTSLKVCTLIREIGLESARESIDFDIIQLVQYELVPCIGCGRCYHSGRCQNDEQFNELFRQLEVSDGLFIVSAHYAPIPSKLCILLEKVEQLAFIHRFNDEAARSPLYKKPVGIVGHGGGTSEMAHHYGGQVLDTIANALSWPVEMNIIKDPGGLSNGVVFATVKVERGSDSLFPVQIYDWNRIRMGIEPLVKEVLNAAHR